MNWVLFFYHVAQHSVLNIMLFFSVSFKIDIGTKNMGWLFEEEEKKAESLRRSPFITRSYIRCYKDYVDTIMFFFH